MIQEAIALGVVACAALFLCVRLTGWPRLDVPGLRTGRKTACAQPEPAVIVGARLARGLRQRDRVGG